MTCEHNKTVEHCVASRLNGNDIEITWCTECGAIKSGAKYAWRYPKHYKVDSEFLECIAKSLEDIKAGRVYSTAEMKKRLYPKKKKGAE
jgi:hypothetical protein